MNTPLATPHLARVSNKLPTALYCAIRVPTPEDAPARPTLPSVTRQPAILLSKSQSEPTSNYLVITRPSLPTGPIRPAAKTAVTPSSRPFPPSRGTYGACRRICCHSAARLSAVRQPVVALRNVGTSRVAGIRIAHLLDSRWRLHIRLPPALESPYTVTNSFVRVTRCGAQLLYRSANGRMTRLWLGHQLVSSPGVGVEGNTVTTTTNSRPFAGAA